MASSPSQASFSADNQTAAETSSQFAATTQPTTQPQLVQWQPTQAQINLGQPIAGQPIQWVPYPWYIGSSPNPSLPGNMGHQSHVQPEGSPPSIIGANPTNGLERTSGSSGSGDPGNGTNPYPGTYNADYRFGSGESGLGTNPYLNFAPGFLPFPIKAITKRPEPGDPLYVSTADGPELRLINLQLTGPKKNSRWS